MKIKYKNAEYIFIKATEKTNGIYPYAKINEKRSCKGIIQIKDEKYEPKLGEALLFSDHNQNDFHAHYMYPFAFEETNCDQQFATWIECNIHRFVEYYPIEICHKLLLVANEFNAELNLDELM